MLSGLGAAAGVRIAPGRGVELAHDPVGDALHPRVRVLDVGFLYIGTNAGTLYVIGSSDTEAAIPAPAAGAVPGQAHRIITRNRCSPV